MQSQVARLPDRLTVEITTRCQGGCVFCNHPGTGEDMSFENFVKVVELFPSAKYVHPQGYGEPTLHPKFVKMLKYLRKNDRKAIFYTNGNWKDYFEMIGMARATPHKVVFSIDAVTAETYRKLRPRLNFGKAIYWLERFAHLKDKTTKLCVRWTECKENAHELPAARKFFKNLGAESFSSVMEAPRGRGNPSKGDHPYACDRINRHAVVKVNGDVVICCSDWHSEYVIGNVLGDIPVYDTAKFQKIKAEIEEGTFPLCKVCAAALNRKEA